MNRRQDNAAYLCVVSHTGGKCRKWRQNDSEVKFVILSHTGSVRPTCATKDLSNTQKEEKTSKDRLGGGGSRIRVGGSC